MSAGIGFATAEDARALLAELRDGTGSIIHGEFAKLLEDDFFAVGRDLEALARLVWAAQVAWADEAD